jgi:hypothetical protein
MSPPPSIGPRGRMEELRLSREVGMKDTMRVNPNVSFLNARNAVVAIIERARMLAPIAALRDE